MLMITLASMNQELNYNSIEEWKNYGETLLTNEEQVIQRNADITSQYAQMYRSNPSLYKWAGMAAFASHHVGLSLLPFKLGTINVLDLQSACKEKTGLLSDLNLVRHLNNRIYHDVGWVHILYHNKGIEQAQTILAKDDHYAEISKALMKIEEGRLKLKEGAAQIESANKLIWEGNNDILFHEQSITVQPIFNNFGAVFKNVLRFCATLDYSASHTKTDWRTHSSFIRHMIFGSPSLLLHSKSLPDLTNLKHRWDWIQKKLLKNWIRSEDTDQDLDKKISYMINHGQVKQDADD